MKNLVLVTSMFCFLQFAPAMAAEDMNDSSFNNESMKSDSMNSDSDAESMSVDSVQNAVETHLGNIRNLVRSCSVQPFALKDGIKVYHRLISHCPQVKVLEKGKAQIKLGSHVFHVTLVDSPSTDDDFYDVIFKDFDSNDTFRVRNVLAYGDVLIGILNGDKSGLPQVYVNYIETN